jgi:hypothetical protein
MQSSRGKWDGNNCGLGSNKRSSEREESMNRGSEVTSSEIEQDESSEGNKIQL